jgi:hypothetical protein
MKIAVLIKKRNLKKKMGRKKVVINKIEMRKR